MVGANNYVFRLEGQPVGLMSVSVPPDGNVKIQGIVSHPNSKGVGGALIQQAVEISMNQGRNGVIELEFLPQSGARAAYEALGFVSRGGLTMTLDPSTSSKWAFDGSQWKLRKPPPSIVHH
jgi:predicted GNAT family acetyltransferase